MQDKITESAIEKFTIELLEKQGYQYIYAPDIAWTAGSQHTPDERWGTVDRTLNGGANWIAQEVPVDTGYVEISIVQ